MEIKEEYNLLKKKRAKLLIEKQELENRIEDINTELKELREIMFGLKTKIFLEEKENLKKL